MSQSHTWLVLIADVAKFVEHLEGVRWTERAGRAPESRYHGRLIARQLDGNHLVIRVDFDFREALVCDDALTFSVPSRYVNHMMVVANFVAANATAIEYALDNAWQLQRSAD